MSHRAAFLRTAVALATAGPLTLLAAGCITQVAPPVEGPAAVKGKPAKGGSAAIDARLRAGVKTAIAYTSREDRMAVMTEAFSLSRNKGLQKASESFKSLGSSLSGLQALTSARSRSASAGSLGGPDGATLTGSSGSLRYHVEGGPTLHMVGSRGGYALAGLAEYEQGDTVIVYDDQTKEVTAVRSADAELRFKFDKRDNTRSWSSEIAKSPDGTTGLLSVEVSSRAWKTYELPQPQAPWVCTAASPRPRPSFFPMPSVAPRPSVTPVAQRSPLPGATAAPVLRPSPSPTPTPEPPSPVPLPFPTQGLQQLDDQPADSWPPATPGPNDTPEPSWTSGPNDTPTPGWFLGPSAQPSPAVDYGYAGPSCGPDPAWQAPEQLPFKAAGGEYPENVETLALRLAITPKGDNDLAMELAADLDEPVSVPNSAMRLPGHWKFLARVPGVTLSWESRLSLVPGRMSFTGSGKMIVEVEQGEEQFDYAVTLREATRTASASMTNVGAKMKLRVTTDGSAPPRTQVLSIDGGREIEVGTVGMKPGSGNVALVRFNDGKTMEWELYPQDLFGQLGSSPAAFQPPAPRAAVPAIRRSPVPAR